MSNQSKETQSNSECKKPIKHEGNRISFCLVVFFFALLKSETNFTQPAAHSPFFVYIWICCFFILRFVWKQKKKTNQLCFSSQLLDFVCAWEVHCVFFLLLFVALHCQCNVYIKRVVYPWIMGKVEEEIGKKKNLNTSNHTDHFIWNYHKFYPILTIHQCCSNELICNRWQLLRMKRHELHFVRKKGRKKTKFTILNDFKNAVFCVMTFGTHHWI